MKLTIEMANEKLLAALRETRPAFRSSMKEMVRKGARLAITKAISITPPMSDKRGPTKETQRFAEKLIQGDVRRVLATASYAYETIKSPAAASAFWFLLKTGGKKTLSQRIAGAESILKEHSYNLRLRDAPIVPRADVSLHDTARVRGRVKKSAHVQQIAIRPNEIDRHIKAKQKNIGFLAAGWLDAAEELKATRIPAWIRRHKGKAPSPVRFVEAESIFIIRMSNKVSYGPAAQLARIIPIALSAAAGSIREEAKKRLLKSAQRAGLATSALAASAL